MDEIQAMRSQFLKWDGNFLHWEDFLVRWRAHLADVGNQLTPEDLVHLLMAQLPDDWRLPLMELRQYQPGNWHYEACLTWLNSQIMPVVPRHQYHELWEKCQPTAFTAIGLRQWWTTWTRLAGRCSLTEDVKVTVFKRAMVRGFNEFLRKGILHEAKGSPMTVEEWFAYIYKKQVGKDNVAHLEASLRTPARAGIGRVDKIDRCFLCNEVGHWARDCPADTRPSKGSTSLAGLGPGDRRRSESSHSRQPSPSPGRSFSFGKSPPRGRRRSPGGKASKQAGGRGQDASRRSTVVWGNPSKPGKGIRRVGSIATLPPNGDERVELEGGPDAEEEDCWEWLTQDGWDGVEGA
jgi:hypothetical protein